MEDVLRVVDCDDRLLGHIRDGRFLVGGTSSLPLCSSLLVPGVASRCLAVLPRKAVEDEGRNRWR